MFLSFILCLCQYEGFCSFYRNIYKTTTAWVEHVCSNAIQLTVSYLQLIVFLPRMHVPVMRWKFLSCPWNDVKNRMSLVVLTAYVDGNINTVVTHLHVVDILAYIYCIFVHLTSLFEVLGQRSKQHMKFWYIHCKYHTGWTALAVIVTIGGTYAPYFMRMASLFFKVKAQGHKLNIVVVVRKNTFWSVQLRLPIFIHILIWN